MMQKRTKEGFDKILSRLERIEKRFDILDSDRQVWEGIQSRLAAVEDQLKLNRKNDNDVRKDLREEIQISGEKVVAKVETKVEEIQDVIEKKKVIFIRKPWWNVLKLKK